MGFGDTGATVEDETPLLEELGIDPAQIVRRTVAMLNPLKRVSSEDAGDDDLAGPLLFGVLMGSLHLMRGRVHFGYILGWTTLATLAMYWLLNQLGAHGEGIELYRCGSIIGYCMLPMCLLAALAPFLPGGFVTAVVAGVLVLWCAGKATMQFMRSLESNPTDHTHASLPARLERASVSALSCLRLLPSFVLHTRPSYFQGFVTVISGFDERVILTRRATVWIPHLGKPARRERGVVLVWEEGTLALTRWGDLLVCVDVTPDRDGDCRGPALERDGPPAPPRGVRVAPTREGSRAPSRVGTSPAPSRIDRR